MIPPWGEILAGISIALVLPLAFRWLGRSNRRLFFVLAPAHRRLPLDFYRIWYLRQRAAAGWDESIGPDDFCSLKELLFFIVFLATWPLWGFPTAGGIGALAFVLPDLKLHEAARRQRSALGRDFAGFMELMVLVLEAGMDFFKGLAFVTAKLPKNQLRGALEEVRLNVSLGRSKEASLKDFAARLGNRDADEFVSAVVLSGKTGAPLAKALNAQLLLAKERRLRAAEKLAQEAPVKLLGPLVAFVFPVVFIVLFGPILMGLLE